MSRAPINRRAFLAGIFAAALPLPAIAATAAVIEPTDWSKASKIRFVRGKPEVMGGWEYTSEHFDLSGGIYHFNLAPVSESDVRFAS